MDITRLKAISPLDGRYFDKVSSISTYLSEAALIYYRLEVEIRYLIALSDIKVIRKLTKDEVTRIESIYKEKDDSTLLKVKEYEEKVKHDVKSIELFLREKFDNTSLSDVIEKIHYCLTSEDVNNIAYRLMIRDALHEVILPAYKDLILRLQEFANENKSVVMMARTHGQDAIPTTLGKEMSIYTVRLFKIYQKLNSQVLAGKLNGAVGGWNAHLFAEPQVNWQIFSQEFIKSLGLTYNEFSTQINQYDDVVETLSSLHLFNGIMLDFDQDCWRYISDGWLSQKVDINAVGSSTMAQKVNPINFENSEGNCQIANGLIEAMTRTLPISRLQRDLSNSTIIRNISTIFAHELLVINSAIAGLKTISPNTKAIEEHLNSNWSILAEPLQILLRKHNVNEAYNIVKEKIMGKSVSQKEWLEVIERLPIDKNIKADAIKINIHEYTGYCEKIVDDASSLILQNI